MPVPGTAGQLEEQKEEEEGGPVGTRPLRKE